MCLRRYDLDPMKTADKDIVCYKLVSVPYAMRNWKTYVKHRLGFFNKYHTLFMEEPVAIGKSTECVTAFPEYSPEELRDIETCSHEIAEGFIHSYANKADAEFTKRTSWCKNYCAVVECIIPEGTPYFVGTQHDHLGYASTKLKYVKIAG